MSRAGLCCLVVAALARAEPAPAQEATFPDVVTTVPLSDTLHSWGRLGGVAVDRLGFVYVANFRDAVWRVSPDGRVRLLADGFYGSSGNAVNARGDLLQASFYSNTVSRVSRDGRVTPLATQGLDGPVGITVDGEGRVFVCNCNANTIVRIDAGGGATVIASGPLFACPNGITAGPEDRLYVVNFSNEQVVELVEGGEPRVFATVPGGGGNAHIAFARGALYVTKIITNQVFKVLPDGGAHLVAGTGRPGLDDGSGADATLARPNGLAADPTGTWLYTNNLVGEWRANAPSRIALRRIELASLERAVDAVADQGAGAVDEAYRRFVTDVLHRHEDTRQEAVTLGYRYLTARNVPVAVTIFRVNAEIHPDDANAHYHLGEAFRFTGDPDGAAEQYRAALRLDPEHRQARARLDAIRGLYLPA